jgi:N-methylhydantoinase B
VSGGFGAKHNEDGMSATVCINDGDTHNAPIEAGEAKAPIVVREHLLRPDSGGPGQFRGGLGIRRVVEARAPITVNSQIERTQCSPWGLNGGIEGLANKIHVERANGERYEKSNGKLYSVQLAPGDKYVIESGGGGGFGDPLLRQPTQVADDVRQGYVSRESASRDYGVVITQGADVDSDATERARAARTS